MSHLRALALFSVAALAGCFSPSNPDCAFTCGSFNNFDCPADYSCNRGDTSVCNSQHSCYCYHVGFTGTCPFPQPDLSGGDMTDAATPGDLATPPDQSGRDAGPAGDLGPTRDGGGSELGMPDLLMSTDLAGRDAAPSDSSSPQDLLGAG